MNNNCQKLLRRVTQNDPSFKNLSLVDNNAEYNGVFYSETIDDYSTLGSAIANNTQLDSLAITLSNGLPLGVADREFYDGLKSNSSISNLGLYCGGQTIAGGVGQEILQVYQGNNSHLTYLSICHANLQNGGDRVIMETLRSCRNLRNIILNFCNIIDEQLLPIVDAVRDHSMLETLQLYGNDIGNAGCEAIATLLIDPNYNLRYLNLGRNTIGNEGSTAIANSLTNNNQLQHLHLGNNTITTKGATTIANSLTNNNKLQNLRLHNNPIDRSVQDVFSNVLCNETSITSIYSSNHTLNELSLGEQQPGQQLRSLLVLNASENKIHIAIRNILKYHPNIDMEPLFQWDAEGEQTLKALPQVMNWFGRANVAVADDDEEYGIEEQKLSAIFQFAKAMPFLFVPPSHIKVDTKKRKR